MCRIETKRLLIRRFEKEDGEGLYEYLSDPEVVKFEPYDVFSKENARKEAANRAKRECFLAVCEKESNKLIGNVYFDEGNYGTWEVGYVFHSKYQGQGYAIEAVKAVLQDGFRHRKVRRVVAKCNADNVRSWKLLEKLGMRKEATLQKNVYFKHNIEGKPVWQDTYQYAIVKEEWKNRGNHSLYT